MLAKVKAFFTPARRKAVYAIVTAAGLALVAFNILTQEQLGEISQTIVTIVTTITTLMAFLNTGASEQ